MRLSLKGLRAWIFFLIFLVGIIVVLVVILSSLLFFIPIIILLLIIGYLVRLWRRNKIKDKAYVDVNFREIK